MQQRKGLQSSADTLEDVPVLDLPFLTVHGSKLILW